MLALGGVCPGSGRSTSPRFETLAHPSCEEGFRKDEAEVVHDRGKGVIKRWSFTPSFTSAGMSP